MDTADEYLDIPTVARLLGLSDRQARLLVKRRAVARFTRPGHGKRLFLRREDVQRLAQAAPSLGELRPLAGKEKHEADQTSETTTTQETAYHDLSRSEPLAQIGVLDSASLALEDQYLRALLQAVRLEAGITQAELSQRLGRERTFVNGYERGQRRVDVLELRRICRALGISPVAFMQRLEDTLRDT